MVLVGVSLIALVGVMALSIDMGRMYLFRAQVHVSADAAALAGADRMGRKLYTGAADTAVAYGLANKVEKTAPTITTANVIPGVWDFGARTFTPAAGGNWSAAANNAVKATSSYTAGYRFGQIFGFTSKVRAATSIAAVGYVGSSNCIRPWSVSYETLLKAIYPASTPGNPYNAAYNLSVADALALAAFTSANWLSLKYDGTTSPGSGTFGAVLQPPTLTAAGVSQSPGSGSANIYRDQIGTACNAPGAPTARIGPGDWLEQNSGNMVGPSKQGVADLCSINGNPQNFTCNPAQPVKIAIYSTYAGTATANGVTKNCSPGCYQVKYIGAFAVTGWDKDLQVLGYFSSLVTSGSFTTTAGPNRKIALVQ